MPLPTNSGPIPNDTSSKLNRTIVPTVIDPNQPGMVVVDALGGPLTPGAAITDPYLRAEINTGNDSGLVNVGVTNLFSFTVLNNSAVDVMYFQFFDLNAAPAGGENPIYNFFVPRNSQIVIGNDFFGAQGSPFIDGLAWGISDDPNLFSAIGIPLGIGEIHYQT